MAAENKLTTWLYNRLSEDTDNIQYGHNITLENILKIAEAENVNVICSQAWLFQILKAMFPCIKKSKVNHNGSFKSSVKGIKFVTLNKELVSFNKLDEFLPNDWTVLLKDDNHFKFCNLSAEKFNGNPIVKELYVMRNGLVEFTIAGILIDLSQFFISSHLHFDIHSIKGLFRCLKIISLCHGAYLEQSEPDIYSSGSKCVKEICVIDNFTKSVVRHLECLRIVTLGSLSSTCKKCSDHKKFKKHDNLRKDSKSDKENVAPDSAIDIDQQLEKIAPNLKENQLKLIAAQIQSSNCKSMKSMRWPKEVICMSLTLYNRNPSAYRELTKNGWLNLPSESLLYLYKSSVRQKPGIIPEMMEWMRGESTRLKVPKEGLYGGIILDEMSIQEDLQIINQGKQSTISGLVDCEPEVMLMHNLAHGKCENRLANHVMQYMFHGLTGFRWPFCNYPNAQAAPADIFLSTWKCVDALYEWGFMPIYCCMDGSSNNRAFLKLHFPDNDPLSTNMIAPNYKNPKRKMIFIMDPCHLIKKIRNSVLSSGIADHHQRLLTIDGTTIQWKMWIDAYMWDQNNHAFKVHHKLTNDHVFPNNAKKMRNHLAFDTLNTDMLHLMKSYHQSLGEAGQKALTGVLQFLEQTSFLVSFFNDDRPIKDLNDTRISKLKEVYNWFKAWEKQVCQNDTVAKRYKTLITMETREDLDFMYYGIMSLIEFAINDIHTEVVPSRLNSDIIENIFCQQRSIYHGPTTNPTYNAYRTGINSVILGQTVVSRKCNASGNRAEPYAAKRPTTKLRI